MSSAREALMKKMASEGKRVVRERFGVDSDTCTGDHSCIRLSGCRLDHRPNPIRCDWIGGDRARQLHRMRPVRGGGHARCCAIRSSGRGDLESNGMGWNKGTRQKRVIEFLQRRIDRRLAGIGG